MAYLEEPVVQHNVYEHQKALEILTIIWHDLKSHRDTHQLVLLAFPRKEDTPSKLGVVLVLFDFDFDFSIITWRYIPKVVYLSRYLSVI